MKTPYILVDTDDGNTIGWYPTENAALHVVRKSLKKFGRESTLSLGLERRSSTAGPEFIADGEELIKLACRPREATVFAMLRYRVLCGCRDGSRSVARTVSGAIEVVRDFQPRPHRPGKHA